VQIHPWDRFRLKSAALSDMILIQIETCSTKHVSRRML
jgi:hypothetical protein